MIFVFKAAVLNKIFAVGFGTVIIVSLILGLTVSAPYEYKYFFSMLCFFGVIIYSFYLNRNELHTLKIQDDVLYMTFFNKSFYKRKDISFRITELEIANVADRITLTHKGTIIAAIHKTAAKPEDWTTLQQVLSPR